MCSAGLPGTERDVPNSPEVEESASFLVTVALSESPNPVTEYWMATFSQGVVREQSGHLFVSGCKEAVVGFGPSMRGVGVGVT